jgi:hypothetical protein
MNKLKTHLGYLLLTIDDLFAKHHIHFNLFVKDKDNHINFLCRWGFNLIFGNKVNTK